MGSMTQPAVHVRAMLLVLGLAPAAFAQVRSSERQFTSRSCHITFVFPAAWEVVDDTTDRTLPCGFRLRPRDWHARLAANDSVDNFTISIRVFPRGVWKQVPESGFERRPNGWVVLGRMGTAWPAESVATAQLRGLRGTAEAGCYRESGTYFGLCDNPTALLGTNSRSLLIIAGPRGESVFKRLVATLSFPQ